MSPYTTAFTFANKLLPGGAYSVTIGSQPTGGLTCTLSNATGTVALDNVQSIAVSCTPVQGKISNAVSIFAGNDSVTNVDGVGGSARFGQLTNIAMDGAGSIYVANGSYPSNIRKVSSLGVVTTYMGCPCYAYDVSHPLAVDNSGNVFIADLNGWMITKTTPDGKYSVLAGGDLPGFGDGVGGAARFNSVKGIALDSAGNVYVADTGNNAIRKISPAGVVSTLAGNSAPGFADGTGGAARFNGPTGLTVDGAGNVFVADTANFSIRKITPSGVVSTVMGGGPGSSAFVDGDAVTGRLAAPTSVVLDSAGNVVVLDGNAVRKISAAGVLSTLAGGTTAGYANGSGAAARFNAPVGLVADGGGNVLVADGGTNRAIRQVSSTGVVTTLAGQGALAGLIDATGTAARFDTPSDVATDGSGNVYVADQGNHAVRKITPTGAVTTLAGGGSAGNVDATGTAAHFTLLTKISADSAGNVYAVDNGAIRKITSDGVVTTPQLQINNAQGIAVDGAGALYVTSNNSVLKASSGGVVTTLAGNGSAGFVNGSGAAAQFNAPSGVAIDPSGNVYVMDSGNCALRRISSQGQVTTLATNYTFCVSYPGSLAVDGSGNVYTMADPLVTDIHYFGGAGYTLKIGSDGVISGMPNVHDQRQTAYFGSTSRGIAVDAAGNLYFAVTGANAIGKIVP